MSSNGYELELEVSVWYYFVSLLKISKSRTISDLRVLEPEFELAKRMLRYNIGCRNEEVLHLKKIDEEFFEL